MVMPNQGYLNDTKTNIDEINSLITKLSGKINKLSNDIILHEESFIPDTPANTPAYGEGAQQSGHVTFNEKDFIVVDGIVHVKNAYITLNLSSFTILDQSPFAANLLSDTIDPVTPQLYYIQLNGIALVDTEAFPPLKIKVNDIEVSSDNILLLEAKPNSVFTFLAIAELESIPSNIIVSIENTLGSKAIFTIDPNSSIKPYNEV